MHPHKSHATAEIRNCLGNTVGRRPLLSCRLFELRNPVDILFRQLFCGSSIAPIFAGRFGNFPCRLSFAHNAGSRSKFKFACSHLRVMYCLAFIPLVELHSNESVRASNCSHAMKEQVRCLTSFAVKDLVILASAPKGLTNRGYGWRPSRLRLRQQWLTGSLV